MKLVVMLSGAVMVGVSLWMIINPAAFARFIVRFVHLKYMHPFEILSRLTLRVLFVLAADDTRHPTLIRALGYLFMAVGAGLVFMLPAAHRRLGIWMAASLVPMFRPAACGALLFGVFLIYTTL